MNIFTHTQDKTKLVLVRRDIEVKDNALYHGKTLLGSYKDHDTAMSVLLDMSQHFRNGIHEYSGEENNVMFAFASTCEVYGMPKAFEVEEVEGGE